MVDEVGGVGVFALDGDFCRCWPVWLGYRVSRKSRCCEVDKDGGIGDVDECGDIGKFGEG